MPIPPPSSKASDSRRDSGSAYRALVENAVYGIIRADRDGLFLAANPAIAEMLGYDSDDELVEATSLPGLFGGTGEYERMRERFTVTGRIKGFETEWRRKDGALVPVRVSGRLLYDDGDELDGFELMVEDVSERSRLEAQLRQAQKMEAIGQLTGGIAHDFNNLLTVIVATSDMLAEPIAQLQPEYIADLENLRAAAQRGSVMARKLLGFSRQGPLALEHADIGRVVANACQMLKPLLPENITLTVARDDSLGTVRADSGAVEQMLMNLVTNARDAMPVGGSLRVDVQRTVLDDGFRSERGWGDPGEYVRVAVSDTGTGMNAETQRRIFEPFFTTKALGAGTGLGMPMVFGLIKQHGGYIDIISDAGEGTSVLLLFPVASEPATLERKPVSVRPRVGTEAILVAEDEEGVRRSARRSLEGLGYTVVTAVDGQEALEVLQANPGRFDLVLTDVGMPRLAGPELFRAARAADVTTPFLFMSAYNADDLRVRTRLPASQRFVSKPWTLTDLANGVRDVLDSATQ